MKSKVIILGAGTGGLTAAYWLLKQGVEVIIIEKELEVGGLMRSVKYKDFEVDYGYKHLYSRIPEVHELWKEILKGNFVPYALRTGILYKGHLLEKEKKYKGLRRGMPYHLLISSIFDMIISKFRYRKSKTTSLANYTYARRGEKFTRIFSKEYFERNKGSNWSQLPASTPKKKTNLFFDFIRDANKVTQKKEIWYHPTKGTGQIIRNLEKKIIKMGGQFYLGCSVTNISHKDNKIVTITILKDNQEINLITSKLVSSLPLQFLAPIMGFDFAPSKNEFSFKRGVIMVYLFLKNEVKFPHTCIQVSCPKTKMSRITNYAAFGGSMVPMGKGCLCVEYFIPHSKKISKQDDDSISELAISECENSGLLNRKDCTHSFVIRSSFADTAVSWEDYKTDATRKKIYERLSNFNNLYQINRTGADKSTYAGIMAAKAIIAGNRQNFDILTQPDHPTPWKNRK